MEKYNSTSGWKTWLRPNRIVPLLTLLVAGGAGILGIFNLVAITPVEGIIIALLALLAIDALTERLSVLENIEARLNTYSVGEPLRRRSQLTSPQNSAHAASEIAIVGVSGISLWVNHLEFFRQKMLAGCRLRILLLDPASPSLQTWNLLVNVSTTERDITTALELLKELLLAEKTGSKCEVRLSKVFAPFGMLMTDPSKSSGLMSVEFYTYKTPTGNRPHVQLSRMHHQYWFDSYAAQFEQMWSDSQSWTP